MTTNDALKTISTDGSNGDTQAAITYMAGKNQDGWVITIGTAGGSYTWTDIVIVPTSFAHSYTIQGAGTGASRTRITPNHSVAAAFNLNTTDQKLARLTNLIFFGSGSTQSISFLYLEPPPSGVGRNSFRIDHCQFIDLQARAIEFNNPNQNNGISYGLIDNCDFITNAVAASGIYIYAGNNANQWTGSMTFGTADTVTIEDCTWTNLAATVPGLPAVDSAYNGARYSVRHCTFKNWVCVAHGADSAPSSTLQVEFHHNTLTADISDYGLYCRGGCYMASDNNFGAGQFPNQCFKFANDSPGGLQKVGQGAVAGVETRLGAYFWNNIPNGNPNIGPLPTGLVLGTNVYAVAPGAGMPITSYTELAYPHPLRAGDPVVPPSGGGGTGGGGTGASGGNPPFQPVTFTDIKPKGGWNTYTGPQEDGPSKYAPVYNGQSQTSKINATNPVSPAIPAKCTMPGGAVGFSKIP